METILPRVILVDLSETSREVMVRRLLAQGYAVETAADPVTGAELALSSPPRAVIADLWMPSISGVQLCRLLRTEPATADVPVILRGDSDDPRSRFWAERAGAAGYVRKGRMSELVRLLAKVVQPKEEDDGFFMQLGGSNIDIRDRIARYLDAALFDSVVAAEVRSLAASGSFERLFDVFSQFLSQVVRYRWLALASEPGHFGLHHHPANAVQAEQEARAALGVPDELAARCVVDEDTVFETEGPPTVVCLVPFAGSRVGTLALAPSSTSEPDTVRLIQLVARELGGPVRMAALMAEQERLAAIDVLTGLRNRRAFQQQIAIEISRSARYGLPLGLLLLDVDHFKHINDGQGHAGGDRVLSALGVLLREQLRIPDIPARWGGEEFVVALPNTDLAGAGLAAERLRAAVAGANIRHGSVHIPVTISVGVSALEGNESLEALTERADQAMYAAKVKGRNCVVISEPKPPLAAVGE
ncbi:MAG: diguanylate cyclase [Deltaproteobacteria bacterium]